MLTATHVNCARKICDLPQGQMRVQRLVGQNNEMNNNMCNVKAMKKYNC